MQAYNNCYLEIDLLMNFGLTALLCMICLSRWPLLIIQSPVKNRSPTTGCLSTWQLNEDLHLKNGNKTFFYKIELIVFTSLCIT